MSQQTPSQQTPSQQTPSQQTPTPEPQPAQPPEDQRPGERDLEIYRAVRIHLHQQKTVALTYGLTPGRISQIVKRVSRHLARLFPGEDLKLRFAEAKRMRLVDFECHERRVEMYRKCQLALEQSGHALIDQQWTYEGPAETNKLVKTVVKQHGQPISMAALREMRRLNNEMQWGGGKPGRREGGKERPSGRKGTAVIENFPPPECLSEADRAEWPQLMREQQELAARRLAIWPDLTLAHASVPAGPQWSYYPWRTEAEHNAALLANLVVAGQYTIEEYYQHLEILELSKPFAHPNLLTKDRSGRWQLFDPQQVPLPVMPPERAALPAESPERVYWPNKSKAAHFAMMRAEMVLRGHLSRDQYESLNAWASWYMNEEYPDPLAQCAEKFNSSATSAEWDSTKAPTSGRDFNGQGFNGQGFETHTTPNIRAAAAPTEPVAEAAGDAVNDCPNATWDEAAAPAEAGERVPENAEKCVADRSGEGTAGPASSGTWRSTAAAVSADRRREQCTPHSPPEPRARGRASRAALRLGRRRAPAHLDDTPVARLVDCTECDNAGGRRAM